MSQNNIDFYDKLRLRLHKTSSWPSKYLFKFILNSNNKSVNKVEEVFCNMNANFSSKKSKNGKYVSISVNVLMKSPEMVIGKYQEIADQIDDVISL